MKIHKVTLATAFVLSSVWLTRQFPTDTEVTMINNDTPLLTAKFVAGPDKPYAMGLSSHETEISTPFILNYQGGPIKTCNFNTDNCSLRGDFGNGITIGSASKDDSMIKYAKEMLDFVEKNGADPSVVQRHRNAIDQKTTGGPVQKPELLP